MDYFNDIDEKAILAYSVSANCLTYECLTYEDAKKCWKNASNENRAYWRKRILKFYGIEI